MAYKLTDAAVGKVPYKKVKDSISVRRVLLVPFTLASAEKPKRSCAEPRQAKGSNSLKETKQILMVQLSIADFVWVKHNII